MCALVQILWFGIQIEKKKQYVKCLIKRILKTIGRSFFDQVNKIWVPSSLIFMRVYIGFLMNVIFQMTYNAYNWNVLERGKEINFYIVGTQLIIDCYSRKAMCMHNGKIQYRSMKLNMTCKLTKETHPNNQFTQFP
jgi:hypothetical protein